MNNMTIELDQNEEDVLIYEISDELLETAYIRNETAGNITLWVCTALYYCPGP